MSLADLAAGKAERHPSICHTCQELDRLPPEDAAVLIAWLEDDTRRYTKIRDDIAEDPDTENLSTDSLRRHADGSRESCRLRGGQRGKARGAA